MSTAQTTAVMASDLTPRPFAGLAGALLNLLRKELRESRSALLVGLIIFWLLPVGWELLFWAFTEKHELVFGFSWLLLACAGWLYAIVIGALGVCRDWGRAEERFLLAQPVSPRAVVLAKLVAGAITVAIVFLVAGAWDLLLWRAIGWRNTADAIQVFVVVFGLMTVGYAVAFAVAVMTRQMLASAMVAGLVLLMWATAPLLSTDLGFLHPTGLRACSTFVSRGLFASPPSSPPPAAWSVSGLSNLSVPLALVSVCVLACAGTAVLLSTRERQIQLGHKPLAWTVAVVVLALFSMAITEVGNALPVVDRVVLTPVDVGPLPSGHGVFTAVANRGSRFAIVRHAAELGQEHWRMTAFRVDDAGQVVDLRHAKLPQAKERAAVQGRRVLHTLNLSDEGLLILSGFRYGTLEPGQKEPPKSKSFDGIWQMRIDWPEQGPPRLLSDRTLPLPHGPGASGTVRLHRFMSASADRYAYLVYSFEPDEDGTATRTAHRRRWSRRLCVMAWADGPDAKPRYEVPLREDVFWSVEIIDGLLTFYDASGLRAATFDADHPETLVDSQPWSLAPTRQLPRWYGAGPFTTYERVGGGNIGVAFGRGVIYLLDRLGLRVIHDDRISKPGAWGLIGEYRNSPLAAVLSASDFPVCKRLDDSLVASFAESAGQYLILYDVSDPTAPRRAGFFGCVYPIGVFATGGYVVLVEAYAVTVLERPALRHAAITATSRQGS